MLACSLSFLTSFFFSIQNSHIAPRSYGWYAAIQWYAATWRLIQIWSRATLERYERNRSAFGDIVWNRRCVGLCSLHLTMTDWNLIGPGILGLVGKRFLLPPLKPIWWRATATPIAGALLTNQHHWTRAIFFAGVRPFSRFFLKLITSPDLRFLW